MLQELRAHGVRDRGGRSCAARPATAATLWHVVLNPLPFPQRYPAALPKSFTRSEGEKKHRVRPLNALRTAASSRAAPHGQRREPPGFGAEGGGVASVRPHRAGAVSAGREPRHPIELRRTSVLPGPGPAPPGVPRPICSRWLPAALGPHHGGAPGRGGRHRYRGSGGAARSCPAAAAPERPRGRAALLGSQLTTQALRALQT